MARQHDPELCVARRGAGYAAWGPGFYVWEEDAGELLREAGALADALRGAGPIDSARRRLAARSLAGQGARRARASSASRRRASIAAR